MTGPGGGAGGGAIRITSDVSITLSRCAFSATIGCSYPVGAHIYSNGGNPGASTTGGSSSTTYIIGGGGSGGAIHLQAPIVSLGYDTYDSVTASGGFVGACCGQYEYASAGRIRIDTNSLQTNAVVTPTPLVGPLVSVPLPTNVPTISVVSINGVNVPPNPTESYAVPDVSINNTGNIPIVVQTQNIPNTTINLYISTEPGTTDSVVPVTLTNGTGSANITLPQGVSRFVVRATW
jgi:hypothetical protein